MKNNWKTEIKVRPSGKSSWYGGAYTIAFVYSNKGNFIVKGYIAEVEEYLKSLHDKGYKYFVNFSLWSRNEFSNTKQHRNIWKFWNKDYSIYEPQKKRVSKRDKEHNRNKWRISKYFSWNKSENDIELIFKRLPKRWIPEMDNL